MRGTRKTQEISDDIRANCPPAVQVRYVCFDIETNGLLPALDTIHSLVIRDLESDERLSCTDASSEYDSIDDGLTALHEAERVYGHNIIGFDLPAVQIVYPTWEPSGRVLDTLVMSRTRFAHLKEQDYGRARAHMLPSQYIGAHSLEAWGHRLRRGVLKTDYKGWCEENGIDEPFAEWRPEMQEYCEDDVDVNVLLIDRIRRAGALSRDTIDMEHDLARYLTQQERNGWPFDFEAAVRLQGELSARREELSSELVEAFGFWYEPKRKHGDIVEFTPKRNNSRYGYIEGATCSRLRRRDFNPGSRQHIANRLQTLYDWEPESFTPTGQPEIAEHTLKGLDMPEAPLLVEYLMVNTRLGQLAEGKKAWLKEMEDDQPEGGLITGLPHIHHACSNTTITHRHRHSHPNLGQVPALSVEYGKEMRGLFYVPEGWKLLGSDAAGLEMRCLAHYMARFDDGEFGESVLKGNKEDGTDPHSRNAEITRLPRDGRVSAKSFFYAYLYGAGDQKLGSFIKPHASEKEQRAEGKKLRAKFESGLEALGQVVKVTKKRAKKPGYVRLIDGRRAYCRSQHAALNTLLQGTGAIICKKWIQLFQDRLEEELGPQGWEGQWAALGWIHDEVQVAVREDEAEDVAQIITEAMPAVGEHFDFRLPLDADYDIGDTWAETH